ncbi:MAG: hypothetical protein IIU83_00660 [Fibrobacteraceae bacterium]|nr:hypothetical protein [Fibrobacteraceae bacterium]
MAVFSALLILVVKCGLIAFMCAILVATQKVFICPKVLNTVLFVNIAIQ